MRRAHMGVLAASVALAVVGVGVSVSTAGHHGAAGPPLCATTAPAECSTTMARAWNLPPASVPSVRTPHGLRFVGASMTPGIGVDVKTMEFVAAPANFDFTFLDRDGQHVFLHISYGNAVSVAHLEKRGTFATRSGHRYFGVTRDAGGRLCLPVFTDSTFLYSINTSSGGARTGTPGCDRVDALMDSITRDSASTRT